MNSGKIVEIKIVIKGGIMFQQLSNKTLIEAYENAKFLRLDEEFISLLELELNNRGLSVKVENTNTKKKRNQSIVALPMTPDLNS